MVLINLSDKDYWDYVRCKIKDGYNYFIHKSGNILVIGKVTEDNGRLFIFEDKKYKLKLPIETLDSICRMKPEIISKERFREECESHLKINKSYQDDIINYQAKSIPDYIPEDKFCELASDGVCGEDINLDDILN